MKLAEGTTFEFQVRIHSRVEGAPDGSIFVSFFTFGNEESARRRVIWHALSYYRHLDATPDDVVIVSATSRPGQHLN